MLFLERSVVNGMLGEVRITEGRQASAQPQHHLRISCCNVLWNFFLSSNC